MTLFEALKFNREPLEMLISLGGKQDDLRFIDLYTEYATAICRPKKNVC